MREFKIGDRAHALDRRWERGKLVGILTPVVVIAVDKPSMLAAPRRYQVRYLLPANKAIPTGWVAANLMRDLDAEREEEAIEKWKAMHPDELDLFRDR